MSSEFDALGRSVDPRAALSTIQPASAQTPLPESPTPVPEQTTRLPSSPYDETRGKVAAGLTVASTQSERRSEGPGVLYSEEDIDRIMAQAAAHHQNALAGRAQRAALLEQRKQEIRRRQQTLMALPIDARLDALSADSAC